MQLLISHRFSLIALGAGVLALSPSGALAQTAGSISYGSVSCVHRSCSWSHSTWSWGYGPVWRRDEEPPRRWNALLLERQGRADVSKQIRSNTRQFEVVNR